MCHTTWLLVQVYSFAAVVKNETVKIKSTKNKINILIF